MISNAELHPLPPDELGVPPIDQAMFASAGDGSSPSTPPPTTQPPAAGGD